MSASGSSPSPTQSHNIHNEFIAKSNMQITKKIGLMLGVKKENFVYWREGGGEMLQEPH